MITPHTIRTVPAIARIRPLAGARAGRCPAGFSPVRRIRKPLGKAAPTAGIHKHTVNHLKLVNNIQLRISLHAPVSYHSSVAFVNGAGATVQNFAGEMVDQMLREELDRQLALMRRGENIGQNQRRRAMLGRYLLAQPYRVIRAFYSVQMRALAQGTAASAFGGDGFQSDIVREVRTNRTQTVYTQKSERMVVHPHGTPREQAQTMSRIADQVIERVERKLRLDRERAGILR